MYNCTTLLKLNISLKFRHKLFELILILSFPSSLLRSLISLISDFNPPGSFNIQSIRKYILNDTVGNRERGACRPIEKERSIQTDRERDAYRQIEKERHTDR